MPELRAVETQPLPLPVELFDEIEPRLAGRYLIKGLLMAGTSVVIFGAPGSGKSFLTLDVCLHIAAVLDWFGRRTRPGKVVYLAAEGQGGLRARVHAWRRHYGMTHCIPFALIPTSVDLLDPAADMAKLRTVFTYLSDRWGGIDLLVVDTLAASFGGGDENGSDMAAYVSNIDSLCAPYGCARIIVTHAPLHGDAKRPRGHGSLWGAADTVLHVTGDKDATARRISVIKQKDGDPGTDILFTLKQVEIGTDEDGDPVTSCVIEESDVDPTAVRNGRRLSPRERITLTALERAIEQKGFFPPREIPDHILNRTRTGKVAELSEWRSEALSALISPDTQPDTARRAFDRYREKLQAAQVLTVWKDWAWLT